MRSSNPVGRHEIATFGPLMGGLETKRPAHDVPPASSPDLDNVVLSNWSVQSRGGFTPLIRKQPKQNAIRNTGVRGSMRIDATVNAVSANFVVVPGAMYAGYRPIYEKMRTALSGRLFFRIDDLTKLHVGNGVSSTSGAPTYYATTNDTTPFQLRVRPILSMGPIKRSHDTGTDVSERGPVEAAGPNHIQWKQGGNQYGATGSESCMPFCFHLGRGAGGEWEFRLSFHSVRSATNEMELLTVAIPAATLPPRSGVNYTATFSIAHGSATDTVAKLRIGVLNDDNQPATYFHVTQTFSVGGGYRAPATMTQTPLQVFDCPMEFLRASTGLSTTTPPGLGLDGTSTGGYWFACRRFEGAVEDVALWATDKLSGAVTSLDSVRKINLDPLSDGSFAFETEDLLSYWDMTSGTIHQVDEKTGNGAPLHMLPNDPIAKDGGWWFNGITSYAMPDIQHKNPNWRHYTDNAPADANAVKNAAFQFNVTSNRPHGCEVTFWPDAIEPCFEQVLMEIHGVLRLVLDTDGIIKGYARNGTAYSGVNRNLYLGAFKVSGTRVVVPGQRYTVALFRDNNGDRLTLYINGGIDAVLTGLGTIGDANCVAGVTLGMGAFRLVGKANIAGGGDGSETPPNLLNVDTRSGFIGTIESARIMVGAATHGVYKQEDISDYVVEQSLLWRIPHSNTLNAVTVASDIDFDMPAPVGSGHAIKFEDFNSALVDDQFNSTGYSLRHCLRDSLSGAYEIDGILRDVEDGGALFGGGVNITAGKMEVYTTFARWILNKVNDDDSQYAGAHVNTIERFWNGTNEAAVSIRSVHEQRSTVADELLVLGPMLKRSIEPDVMSQFFGGAGSLIIQRELTSRGRPYRHASPMELMPRWVPGMAIPLTGKHNVTLLADWTHNVAGEQFTITATGANIYWLKPLWRTTSPFSITDKTLWFYPQPNSFMRLSATAVDGELIKTGGIFNTLGISVWVKPEALDGQRVIAFRGTPGHVASTFRCNWMLATYDGWLYLIGTGDNNTRTWVFRQGAFAGGPAVHRPDISLRKDEWNHIYVLLGLNSVSAASCVAWINGNRVVMTLDPDYDTLAGSNPDQNSYPIYLGGVPQTAVTMPFVSGVNPVTQVPNGWHGCITELRVVSAEEASWLATAGVHGKIPKTRSSDSATTEVLFHLNEGSGWTVASSAATNAPFDGGLSQIAEAIPVFSAISLRDSSKDPYEHVIFRDRLYITNGLERPLEVKFVGFDASSSPFRVNRLGVKQPYLTRAATSVTTFTRAGLDLNQGNVTTPPTYSVWMTFADEDGRESEGTKIGTFTASANFAGIFVSGFPRSHDPQVVTRRLYMSAPSIDPTGGDLGTLLHVYADNISVDVQAIGVPETEALITGVNVTPPRAKGITVGQGTIFLSNLTDVDAGQSAFAWSRADVPTAFPAANRVVIDEQDGQPILAAKALLGRLYLFKRDSIYQFEIQALGDGIEARPFLRPVNESVGMAGVAGYDNVLFGANDRGALAFDGANVVYTGTSLEGDWAELHLSNGDLAAFRGVYYRRGSQFWLSTRKQGESYNEVVYVLHTAVGDAQAWTRLTVPRHTSIGHALSTNTQEPTLLLGTTSGQILVYNDDIHVDGADGESELGVNPVLADVVLSSTTTSATILTAGNTGFPLAGTGLHGCTVRFSNGVTRVIESNGLDVIRWIDPVGVSLNGLTFEIGGYLSYWTSGWIDMHTFGQYDFLRSIRVEHTPNQNSLTVQNVAANGAVQSKRAWSFQTVESRAISMASGWQEQPIPVRTQTRGRYHRIRFQTDGIRVPWAVSAFALTSEESGVSGVTR